MMKHRNRLHVPANGAECAHRILAIIIADIEEHEAAYRAVKTAPDSMSAVLVERESLASRRALLRLGAEIANALARGAQS